MASRAPSQKTFWVLEKRQILCLASARRQDIIDKLVATGPMSIRELAPLVGASPASLYHHFEKLLRVGLVIVTGHRVVNRRREKIYATRAPRMRLMRALADPANRAAMGKVGSALARQLQRDFEAGVRSPRAKPQGAQRNVGFFRLVGSPSREGMAAINRHFAAVAEILWRSSGKRAGKDEGLITVGWVMAPVDRKRT